MTNTIKTYMEDDLGNALRPVTDWGSIENAPDFASQIQDVKNSLTGDSGTWTNSGLTYLNGASAEDANNAYKFVHIGAYKALLFQGNLKLPALTAGTDYAILKFPTPDWWDSDHAVIANYLIPEWNSQNFWLKWDNNTLTIRNHSSADMAANGYMDIEFAVLC